MATGFTQTARALFSPLYSALSVQKAKMRQLQGLNLRGETPSDFKSDALDHSAKLTQIVVG